MKVELEVNRLVYDKSEAYRLAVHDMLTARIKNNQRLKYLATRKIQATEAFYQRPDFDHIYTVADFVRDNVHRSQYAEIKTPGHAAPVPGVVPTCSLRLICYKLSASHVRKGVVDDLKEGLGRLNHERRMWRLFVSKDMVDASKQHWMNIRLARACDGKQEFMNDSDWEEVCG